MCIYTVNSPKVKQLQRLLLVDLNTEVRGTCHFANKDLNHLHVQLRKVTPVKGRKV